MNTHSDDRYIELQVNSSWLTAGERTLCFCTQTKVHINQYDGEALTRPLSIPSNERTLRFYTKAKVHVLLRGGEALARPLTIPPKMNSV